MIKLFRKFDPRIASELRSQRKLIVKGLVCVAFTSLLTAATIPLTEKAMRAIQGAAPVAVDVLNQLPGEQELAEEFGVSRERAREGLSKIEQSRSGTESDDAKSARQDEALRQLGFTCLLVVAIFGLKYFFTRGQAYYLSKASARLASDLRLRLFSKLQRLPISYFNERRTGSIQSVLTNDVNVYQNAVTLIRDSIDGPIKAIAALVMIFFIQWQLALVALFFVPILAWFVNRNGKKMKVAQAGVQDELANLTAFSQEALSGTRVIKAFSAEEKMSGIFEAQAEKQYQAQLMAIRRFAQLRPMVELLGAISLAAILFICGFLAKSGTLQISQIVALTLALDIINQGARSLANVNNTYNQVQAAADRIYSEVLDVPDEMIDAVGAKPLPNPVGKITFDRVTFSYPDGTPALKEVSFEIEPGTSLALVGPSGAGKSTIADLVLRFYDPTGGRILFDGVDYRDLPVHWLRQQFGVVPQQTFLFAGSIRQNLMLGSTTATELDIERATELAHATPFISASDDGLQTELGERGVRLSGGEMQRLAIARALVTDPKILLLDEATSNLDAVSEKKVTEALEEVMHTRTTLFIAHRLTTASRADRILLLRAGEVVETGTHADLMAKSGSYAVMFKAFTSGVLDESIS